MTENRRKYTREFKIEAVQLLDTSGKSGREIEDDLGISRGQIYRWRRQLVEENGNIRAFPGTGKARDEEVAQLKREHAERYAADHGNFTTRRSGGKCLTLREMLGIMRARRRLWIRRSGSRS